jgi:hypothetical protein
MSPIALLFALMAPIGIAATIPLLFLIGRLIWRRTTRLMSGQIIVGKGRELRNVADDEFVNAVNHLPERMAERLAFMSRDHHTVRDFVVRARKFLALERRMRSPRPSCQGAYEVRGCMSASIPVQALFATANNRSK